MPARTYLRIAAVTAALGAAVAGGVMASGGSSDIYVVQPGDSLWAIAARSGTTVTALASANDLDPNGILPVGAQLVIPGSGSSPASSSGASTAGSGQSAAVTPASVSGVVSTWWCGQYSPVAGPSTLPSLLVEEPGRLALRPLFVEWGEHYGVSPALLEAIAWQESGWQEGVVSVDGAVGVGQVLPATSQFVEQEIVGESLDPASSVSDNIRVMAAYVGYLQAHVASTCDTIAAYYEGLGNLADSGVFSMSVPYVQDVEYLLSGFS